MQEAAINGRVLARVIAWPRILDRRWFIAEGPTSPPGTLHLPSFFLLGSLDAINTPTIHNVYAELCGFIACDTFDAPRPKVLLELSAQAPVSAVLSRKVMSSFCERRKNPWTASW